MRKMVKLRTPKAIPIVVFLCDKQAGQEMNDIAVSYCSDAQTNLKDEKQDPLCLWCKANKELV